MPVSLDTHLQSAKERPWEVDDPPVEPWYLAWSKLERLCFFLMGVGLPVLNVVSLAVLGATPIPRHARRFGIVENYPLITAAVVFSALGWSSLCLAVCCLAPRRISSRLIQSGLGVGLLFWLPVVCVMIGSFYLWILVPSLAMAIFLVATAWMVTQFFSGGFRFSIGKIMGLTTTAALLTAACMLLPQTHFFLLRASASGLVVGTVLNTPAGLLYFCPRGK